MSQSHSRKQQELLKTPRGVEKQNGLYWFNIFPAVLHNSTSLWHANFSIFNFENVDIFHPIVMSKVGFKLLLKALKKRHSSLRLAHDNLCHSCSKGKEGGSFWGVTPWLKTKKTLLNVQCQLERVYFLIPVLSL